MGVRLGVNKEVDKGGQDLQCVIPILTRAADL